MKKIFFILTILITSNYINGQNKEWLKVIREHKTVENITYFFDSNVPYKEREFDIELCRKSIKEDLAIINEKEYKKVIEIEFLTSRKEMLKYSGLGAQGLAIFERDIIFMIHKNQNSPIKHEMMHMISMDKWGDTAESSHWMNEGLATYAGGTCSKYTLEEIYQYFMQSGKLIPMNTIANDFYSANDMITYTQSAFLVKYLIDTFGFDKFSKLWKEGYNNFNKIYGFEFEQMQNQIKSELKIKYPKDIEFNWEEFNKGCI
ncbi:peptidase MA family metallohydrolase [Flavobacterium sp. 5]|uniref:peptidase MA family metallohydrolase n=1 Tax=Flavobacterium sp. 5 TaxID=2035199 RepID=UPI000C2CB11C|nr:peptidase MA family metallohydrolase [Flavobacterium sp. 5]PKB17655.1 peptidase MA superfamily protein [Flavobacterium sp. 5]